MNGSWERLQHDVAQVSDAGPGIVWSICIRSPDDDQSAVVNADMALPTASVGKILLLAEIARRMDLDETIAAVELSKSSVDLVSEAGLWQQLTVSQLAVSDLVALVCCVSDNLATNVLLEYVGLTSVRALSAMLGLQRTALLDRIRSERLTTHPAHLSVGAADELAWLMAAIARGTLLSPTVSQRLREWLSVNADLSMVAAAFGLDPLAHRHGERGFSLYNKTGSDPGTKADVGTVSYLQSRLSYAVVARWAEEDTHLHDEVLAGMAAVGGSMRRHLAESGGPERSSGTTRER